jgi:outer membrane protein assembly factor BamB
MRRLFVWPVVLFALMLAVLVSLPARAADWPQWLGPNRDGVWRETGLVDKFPAGGPKVLWRTSLGTGYSGPAVAEGLVYVMDRERAKDDSGKPLAATKEGIKGIERILCLNAGDGKQVWKHEYDCPYKGISYPSGPRVTPLVQGGRVYTVGTMGDMLCLDAKSGAIQWSKNLPKEYKVTPPVWGYSAHLLLDGDLLYTLVGGKGSAVAAFHKDTGKEVWKALASEEVCYCPPMIYEAGGKRQLIIWLSDSINGLNPASGETYWTRRYPTTGRVQRPAVSIATPQRSYNLLFISSFYHGPMMLKLADDKPDATVLWEKPPKSLTKPEGLSILMATPVFRDGLVFGVGFDGGLICLEAETGKQLWETYAATGGKKSDCGTAFLIPQGDRFVIYNDQGDLILANLSAKGYQEIDRAHILDAVQSARGRTVVWSHPAFAQRCVFARNDKEMICISLAAEG